MIRTLFIMVMVVLMASAGMAQDIPVVEEAKGFADPNLQWSPNSLRGGINFRLSEPRASEALIQAQLETNSFCGFDFNALLNVNIEALLRTVPDLLQGLLLAYVFALVCENFPVICDVFKDARQFINFTLRASRASCQRIISIGRAAGVAARGEAEAACIKRVINATGDPDLAVTQCTQDPGQAVGPNGIEGGTIDIMQVLGESAGLDPFWADLLSQIGGYEVSLTSSLFRSQRQRQPDFELLIYDQIQNRIIEEIQTRLEVFELGGEPPPIQAPGQPVPNDTLRAMTYMGESNREFWKAKLAGALAIGEAQWTIDQLQAQLRDATEVSEIPASQRKVFEELIDRLKMATQRLEKMKAIYDTNLLPVVAALQAIAEEREQEAGQVFERVRNTEPQPSHIRETGQQPMGYRQ